MFVFCFNRLTSQFISMQNVFSLEYRFDVIHWRLKRRRRPAYFFAKLRIHGWKTVEIRKRVLMQIYKKNNWKINTNQNYQWNFDIFYRNTEAKNCVWPTAVIFFVLLTSTSGAVFLWSCAVEWSRSTTRRATKSADNKWRNIYGNNLIYQIKFFYYKLIFHLKN